MVLPRVLGACSWSLRAASPKELVRDLEAIGVRAVQLALAPLVEDEGLLGPTLDALAGADVALPSGMLSMVGEDYTSPTSIRATGGLRPTKHWRKNRARVKEAARLAASLELGLVSFHAGFLPEERSHPERARLLARLGEVLDLFLEEGVAVALETGQESARGLLAVLDELDRPGAGVNFDPANFLLYDADDPLEALETLAPRVLQIHVKDARRPRLAGEWGEEAVVGEGQVDWPAFFATLAARGLDCDLMIEREAGASRVEDMRAARLLVERELARVGRPLSEGP